MYKTLLVEKKGEVAVLTLNRPDALNAMDFTMREEIPQALAELEKDDKLRVVIITGAGRAFCAGGDKTTMGAGYKANGGRTRMRNIFKLFKMVAQSDKIFIAAINGAISGNGLSLACCCDFRIAVEGVKFAVPFLDIGLVPDCGILYTLPRLIGVAKTKELALLAGKFDSQTAFSLGLVNQLVKSEQLLAQAEELAQQICKKSYVALALTKNIINKSYELSFENLLELEASAQDSCFLSEEHGQAIEKFMAKR